MESGNINEELETAVIKENLGEVKRLLSASAGANINYRFGEEKSTLLHLTRSSEITKELLSHGAYVNATNGYRETPLLFAIKQGKKMELVRELLKHGADVNATDRKGNTALNISVKKNYIDLTVIKELLKYGGDINIKNREHRAFDNCASPLDHAVGCLGPAKLFIKYEVLKNFKEGYRNIIDLDVYKNCINFSKLSCYQDDCVSEILKMKTYMITDDLSLFELITNNINVNILCSNQLSIRLAKYDYSLHYPVYEDIISEKIEPFIERASLLNKISELHIYTESGVSNQDVKEKIILDSYAVYNIAEYLSNNELSNLIIAFYDFGKQTNKFSSHANDLELNRQSDTRLSEASTSNYSNVPKRARLE